MNKAKLIIGLAYHRKADWYPSAPYLPIQVGAIYNQDLGIQKDSDGENISEMNAYCSEMSASYWLWKNSQADYKGLFHYRRFMTFKKLPFYKRLSTFALYYLSKLAAPFFRDARCFLPLYSVISIQESEVKTYLDQFAKDIQEDISRNNVALYSLGYIKHSTRSVRTHLNLGIGGKHFETLEPLIEKRYPEFYPYFQTSLRSGKFIGYNILIARSDIFDLYGKIVFSILEDYHNYFLEGCPKGYVDKALLRDSGYVAEVLTDAFIRMMKEKGVKTKALSCAFVEMPVTGNSYVKKPLLQRIKSMLF